MINFFEPANGGTVMIDVLTFAAPFGVLGWVAERVVLAPHLRRFLVHRGEALKQMAEGLREEGSQGSKGGMHSEGT